MKLVVVVSSLEKEFFEGNLKVFSRCNESSKRSLEIVDAKTGDILAIFSYWIYYRVIT